MKKVFLFLGLLELTSGEDLRSALRAVADDVNRSSTKGATMKLSPVQEAPAVVTVYTSEDIKKAPDLWHLLDSTSGVSVDWGGFGHRYVNIRGIRNILYHNKSLLVVNGFRLSDPIGPHFSLDQIPASAIHRLEVLRGVGSELYGSNAFSGVLALELKEAQTYHQDYFEVKAGTADGFGLGLSYSDPNPEGGTHFFALDWSGNDGSHRNAASHFEYFGNQPNGWLRFLGTQRPFRTLPSQAYDYALNQDLYRAAGTSSFKRLEVVWAASRLQHDASYQNGIRAPFYGGVFDAARRIGPSSPLYRDPSIPIPSSFDFGSRVRSNSSRLHQFLGLRYNLDLPRKWKGELRLSRNFGQEESREYDYYLFNVRSEASSLAFESRFFRDLSPRLKLTVGFEHQHVDFLQWNHGNGIAEASRVWTGNAIGNYFEIVPDRETWLRGSYVQALYQASKKLKLQLAGRWNEHQYSGSEWTPKFAAVYQMDSEYSLKIAAGRSLRYASPSEMFTRHPFVNFFGNPALKPEILDGVDLTLGREWNQGKNRLSLTRYRLRLENLIEVQNGTHYSNIANPVFSRGWELEYRQHLHRFWKLNLALSRLDFHDSSTPGGKLPGTWNRMLSWGLEYTPRDNLAFYLNAKHMGPRTDNVYASSPDLQSYDTYQFTTILKRKSGHELRLDAINLLDEDYPTILYSVQSHKLLPPPEGRRFLVSWRIPF